MAPAGERHSADEVLFQDLGLDDRILRAVVEDLQFRACSPIQAKALTVAARNADYTYSGTTTNMIWAFDWMVNHPKETVTLMELENPNAAALADFAAHAVVADYDESVFKSEPSVTVSPDGMRLLLTAPRIKLPPGFMLIVR